ncbi:hypothetical protein H632_c3390p0, partial [Helicosporidium sp. ATCC 50920]
PPASPVFYYQGLHDVASVLLLTCGEGEAVRLLRHLLRCHLRDCTRPGLEPALGALALLYPLLAVADPGLAEYIAGLDEPALQIPHFALSWVLTWFAHDVRSLPVAARLFDLFLASHPLMPLYLAAVALRARRRDVLAAGEDGLAAYHALKHLQLLHPDGPSVDCLAREAAALYASCPPASLVRRAGKGGKGAAAGGFLRALNIKKGLSQVQDLGLARDCVTPHAVLRSGVWVVPERPPGGGGARGAPWAAWGRLAASFAVVAAGYALATPALREHLLRG